MVSRGDEKNARGGDRAGSPFGGRKGRKVALRLRLAYEIGHPLIGLGLVAEYTDVLVHEMRCYKVGDTCNVFHR